METSPKDSPKDRMLGIQRGIHLFLDFLPNSRNTKSDWLGNSELTQQAQ